MGKNAIENVLLIFVISAVLAGSLPEFLAGAPTPEAEADGHPPLIVIPRLSVTSEPNTDFSQAPWSNAARLTGFIKLGGEAMAAHPTWVQVAYGQEALWVGFRCEGQAGDDLKAELTQRDGPVSRDDSVELVICPSGKRGPLFHFVVNSAGVTYDAKGADKSWDANWTVRTTIDQQGWSAVMVIPYTALTGTKPPEPGQTWGMNFCRNARRHSEMEWSTWSPATVSVRDARCCGQVEFGSSGTKPVRFAQVNPVVIGSNALRVNAPPWTRYRLQTADVTGRWTLLSEGPMSAEDSISFWAGDDTVRRVRLDLREPNGCSLGRACYPIASPVVSDQIRELQIRFDEVQNILEQMPEGPREHASSTLAEVGPLLKKAVAIVANPARYTADNWERLAATAARLQRELDGPANYARTLAKYPKAGFAVGLAGPAQKIMIKGQPFPGCIDDSYELELARNEHEGFQVVVMPFQADLRNVTVSISPLTRAIDGERLRGAAKVSLVGHVDVVDDTRYKVDHHGWWPDPLLDFQNRCDVGDGEHVAFWIDVATEADADPDRYRARVTVSAKACDPIEIDLNVRVWDFQLAAGSPLRTAFAYNEAAARNFYADRWDRKMQFTFYDFLLEHRLNVDQPYRRTPPDVSLLGYFFERGQNAFNVGSVFRSPRDKAKKEDLDRYSAELKDKGLFPFAYVYGFDEVKVGEFVEVREVFGRTRENYPGLKTMTTAIDHSYGRETGLRDFIDIWVPLTDWYDLDEARILRAEGKQVWWYICIVPEHPYANWFVEYPAIEARLLMGAMSHKYEVDGFLYYSINRWIGNDRPITSGPYTKWNPGSLVNQRKGYTANGDGSLICPGPDGPLSTIRLENIRDGLEDYAYLHLLAEQTKQLRSRPVDPRRQAHLQRVAELLAVPSSVVRNLTEYTRDPKVLYGFRTALAEAILEGRELLQQ